MTEMLIAICDGFVEDDGELVEITRGVSRVAPEILRDRPQYAEFFEEGVGAAGSDAERTSIRGIDATDVTTRTIDACGA